jgi:hypothetical protein
MLTAPGERGDGLDLNRRNVGRVTEPGLIDDARVLHPTADTAVLTYRWRSRRGEGTYAAVMSSVYVRRDGAWRLVLHQQTPEL